MERTRWAVLGPGEISGFFARALPRSEHGVLHAVGSSDAGRAEAFASRYGAPVHGTYDDVLARDDVDAVYIGTVHTGHAPLAIAALEAGKAVLCEKPVTPTAAATAEVLAAAERSGRPFVEAFKHSFGPLARELRTVVQSGEIGELVSMEAAFGFAAGEHTGRLFDPALAGGAILDVGGYPASLAVAVARWADRGEPVLVSAEGTIGQTGVDVEAVAVADFGGFTATLRTAIVTAMPEEATIVGTRGSIHVPDVWGSREESPARATVRGDSGERVIEVEPVDPFAAEADAVSLALAEGRREVPEVPWASSAAISRILDEWRARLG
ncbi:Gfo/Idh/MocA family protein [Microbacterium sp. DT81.1]|uniref:Gfo/Idh/MocA family protein n=1 Tax=Microbacterium sp. DT81.1 TaxID=3393413 RepID=UPI003CF7F37B